MRVWLRALWLSLAIGVFIPGFVPPVAAQNLPPAVAVVVDYQRILRDAKAARSIRAQVDARHERYQEQIAREERRLHDLDRELDQQRSVLTPEAFAEKRKQFDSDVAGVQRMVQERRRQLDDVSAEAFTQVRNSIIEIIGELSEIKGFNLVLPSSGVLLFAPQIDLTEQVLALLDEQLPDVRVPENAAQ